jgi:hypothetical protein
MKRTYRSALAICSIAVLASSALLAQNAPSGAQGGASAAPRHDLTGVWLPVRGIDGIQPNGARDMPADGKHEPPYTAAGLAAFKLHKPSNGTTEVGPGDENDPGHACDPLGFPRADLFEIRATQFVQTPEQVIVLYTYNKLWRSIWSDGRALPKDPDPGWYGYSSGKWTDDYTFVAQTIGLDERTWVDNSGRPHSDELKVEEVFHRVSKEGLEITVTLDDPKFYSKPWVAMNKMPFKLAPAGYQFQEMMCSPSELAEYNRRHANPGGKK